MNKPERPRVADSRKRIVAAARRLFAAHGVGAVSIRSVVRESGVNVAAVHYHFGSKEGLVRAVFLQASARLNADRAAHLERAIAHQGDSVLPVRDILNALYWPLFRPFGIKGSDELADEFSFLAQLSLDPSAMTQRILDEHEQDVRILFDEHFRRALPGVPAGEVQLRIGCSNAAAWGLIGEPRMLERMFASKQRQPTLQQVFSAFLRFAVAGMTQQATCDTQQTQNRRGAAASAAQRK